MQADVRFAFFGTGRVARYVLEELERAGYIPELVVTAEDARKGRGMERTPSLVSVWAAERGIAVLKPETLDEAFCSDMRAHDFPVFIIADYGRILPSELVRMPPSGVVNMHPSLLPRLRGASPVQSAILNDERETGVTIMRIDDQMDHGPILAQRKIPVENWPPTAPALEEMLAREGGRLLAQMLPLWIAGEIEPQEQNHDVATYCGKIKKKDGALNLSDSPYTNLLKIRGLAGWPGTYTFFERDGKKIRVQILEAHIDGDALIIERVRPEGKRDMAYEELLRSGAKPI